MKRRGIAMLALLVALAAPSAAHARADQETQFQDDSLLVYPPAGEVAATMDTLKALGVDRLRISVYWRLVAPNADSRTAPSFKPAGATDPSSYPAGNWTRYDTIVKLAAARGLAVNFNVTGSAPDWGTQPSPDPEVKEVYYPSPGAFGSFVQAVGKRYSGSYVPPVTKTATGQTVGGVPLPPLPGTTGATGPTQVPGTGPPLPRVSYWSLWNEPDQSHFLAPQWRSANGGRVEAAPKIYRQLVDAAARGLTASGHLHDTVLIGETAPKGRDSKLLKSSLKPLRFIRRLYCVSDSLRPLRGSYARALGCPTSNQRSAFPKAHPALFYATGFAHHPYALLTPPAVPSADRDFVALADLPRLTGTLARIRGLYGFRGTLPIYYTEFGYQSRPPDPLGYPLAVQAAFINQSEFMGYTSPFVRSYHQFLLRDAEPNKEFPSGSILYWSSFQTGIETLGGGRKPAFNAFRMPIWIPGASRRSGGSFRVWGVLRPAANGSRQTAEIQFRPRSGGAFRTIKRVTIRNRRNVIDTHVTLRRSGSVRLHWRGLSSRNAPVSIG